MRLINLGLMISALLVLIGTLAYWQMPTISECDTGNKYIPNECYK